MLRGRVPDGHMTFRVEEYKKPEYEVTVEGPKEPVRLGDEIEAIVKATYYHGAPVTEATVKVKVQRFSHSERWFPSGRWDWLYGRGYWWFGYDYEWYPGWSHWGCVAPVPSWWDGNRWTPPELVLEREYPIEAGRHGEGRRSTPRSRSSCTATWTIATRSRRRWSTPRAAPSWATARCWRRGRPFDVTTWLDRGYARPGEPVTLSFRGEDAGRAPGDGVRQRRPSTGSRSMRMARCPNRS